MKYRVVEAWQASYATPIRVAEGDPLCLTGRGERWDGHLWLWACSAEGLEGWVPDTIIRQVGEGHVATEAYTAIELTCQAGQILTVRRHTHGWAFCIADDGAEGWVPLGHLSAIAL